MAGSKERWRELRPGPPRADVLRYRAFNHIMTRAVRRYETAPSRFPVLFLAGQERAFSAPSAGASDLERWVTMAENMTVVSVAGDHFTMLEAPYVGGVAAAITDWMYSPARSGER